MKRISMLIALAMVASLTATAASASNSEGYIAFVGGVVNGACSGSLPLPGAGAGAGVGTCGASGQTYAMYVQHTSMASGHTGVAMLDYFADRPGGARKAVVTREYR